MQDLKLCDSDYKFMTIVWEHAPLNSGELVTLCSEQLGWKKSTTYTVIKKLIDKGIVKNENTIVSSLITKEEADRQEGEELLQRTTNGNVPAFLATFLKDRKLSKADVENIRQLIDNMEE